MKSTKSILILIALLSTTVYYSCKKSTEDPAPAPPNPAGSPNYLCDGNGDTTYFPLDSANTWTYYYRILGLNQTSPHITITGYTNVLGHKYAVLTDATILMYSTPYLLREDSVSHDIYNISTVNGLSYLEVPHSPAINQDWALPGGAGAYHKTVTNLSATLATA